MKPADMPVLTPLADDSSVGDFWSLLKPGVMSLVVFTGFAGMYLAPGHLHPFLQLITVMCVALGSGAGGALNMWYDRDIDAVMQRTQRRPIPAGRIAPEEALALGIGLSLLSVVLLGLATNWLAAGILAFAIFFYAVVYTAWLKRSTSQNIVIGGAAGAFPPIIGWAAVTGDLQLLPVLLFLIIFLWTPPHFWALALYRNGDYAKAGVPMLPVTHGKAHTRLHMLGYTVLLTGVTLLPSFLGLAGWLYGAVAAGLGAYFTYHAVRVWRSEEDGPARAMFGYSIVYLFALFTALMVDKAWVSLQLNG